MTDTTETQNGKQGTERNLNDAASKDIESNGGDGTSQDIKVDESAGASQGINNNGNDGASLPHGKTTTKRETITEMIETNNFDIDREKRKLRYFLRLHLWAAFKFTNKGFHFHPIQCIILAIQIVKVVVITQQMVSFGREHANFTEIIHSGHVALRHLLLKNWEASDEVLPYPPSGGPYAVYYRKELGAYVKHAVEGFYNYPKNAIGFYRRMNESQRESDMEICIKSVAVDKVDKDGKLNITVKCFLADTKVNNDSTASFDLENNLDMYGMSKDFENFLRMDLHFILHSVRTDEEKALARCLNIEGTITFLEPDGNGQVMVDLVTTTTQIPCMSLGYNLKDSDVTGKTSTSIAVAVIFFTSVSCLTATIAIVFGIYLIYAITRYKKLPDNTDFPPNYFILSYGDRCVRLWDLITVIGDILTISGTTEIAFSKQVKWTLAEFDNFTVWIGIGCLLAWISLLRYFRFHRRFHLLFKALYKSMVNVFAYLLCVCVLFLGFLFCGYVVIGPYNVKFQTLTRTAECLFSLVNGDEVFFTMTALDEKKTGSVLIWWFTRVYVCLFVSLFTIVILNLLIAIFNTVYEEIQSYNKDQKEDAPPLHRALKELLQKKAPAPSSEIYKTFIQCVQTLNEKDLDTSAFTTQEIILRQEIIKALNGKRSREKDPLSAFIAYTDDEDVDVKSLCECLDMSCSCFYCLRRHF